MTFRKIPAEPRNRPAVALSPNGKLLATAGGDSLRLWDAAAGAEKNLFGSPYTDFAAFASQGSLIAWVRGSDVYLGDVTTGKLTRPLQGHQLSVTAVAFSADARFLATGSGDGTVLVWDVPGQKLLDLGVVTAAEHAGNLRQQPTTVPADARVSIDLPRKEVFLGEPITVQFCVENVGKGLFQISTGGDYRGASRHLRFEVKATDEKGKPVVDPEPSGFCLGGIGSTCTIYPGKKECMDVPLLAYCRFDKPGKYSVHISHDLGWQATEDRPHPVAECVLHLKRPSPEQAKKIIDALAAANKSGFCYLRDPIYLPLLLKAAHDGDEHALAGIGSIATPEATEALVGLAGQVAEKRVQGVVQTLNERLPDPQAQGKLPGRNLFVNDRVEARRLLSAAAWRADFAPATRALARKLLTSKNAANFEAGAFVLECIGEKEDMAALVTALDAAVTATRNAPLETNIYPRPRGSCRELGRAATMLNQRFEPSPAPPKSPGAAVVYLNALGTREAFRPPNWEATVAALLGHEVPYVRETAVINVPQPVPATLRKRLPALLLDANVNVQIAACNLAAKIKLPELKQPALKVLATARDSWLLNAVENALWELGGRYELIEVFVGRLNDPETTAYCLDRLASWIIVDGGAGSIPGKDSFDAASAKTVQARWTRFLTDHGKALRDGKRFPLADAALTPDLFPHVELRPRLR